MVDRAITGKEYAEMLSIGYSTFRRHYAEHPTDFAPSFTIGKCRRWWLSTVCDFHRNGTGGFERESTAQKQ